MDFTYRRPAQNWQTIPDWQARILRNAPHVGYDPKIKLHERVMNIQTGQPLKLMAFSPNYPLYHEHHHVWVKGLTPEKNVEDLKTYKALDEERTKGMWLEKAPMA